MEDVKDIYRDTTGDTKVISKKRQTLDPNSFNSQQKRSDRLDLNPGPP